ELYADPQVGTFHAARASLLLAESAPKMPAENIAELREDVFHVHPSPAESAKSASCSTANSSMAILVIALFLFRVAQNLISFCGFFEFFFGLFVAWIFIGVVLQCHFPVGFFDFLRISRFGYSQYFVIISFGHKMFFISRLPLLRNV